MFSLYFLIKRNLNKFKEIGNDDLKPILYSFEIEGQTFTKSFLDIFKQQSLKFQLNYSKNYILFNKYLIYFEDDILKFQDESLPLKDKFPKNINDWTEEIQFYYKLKYE